MGETFSCKAVTADYYTLIFIEVNKQTSILIVRLCVLQTFRNVVAEKLMRPLYNYFSSQFQFQICLDLLFAAR